MDTMTALTQLIQEAQERSELTRALHGTFDFSGDDANFLFSSSRTTPATTPLPVCFSDSVRYYYSLLNDPTVPLEEAPYIFEDMLRDPALFSRVEYSPMSSFSDMLRDTASKWWFLCARKILQRATENSANPSKQDEEPTDCVERGKLNQDYHNIRSVLLLVLALLRPYSSMSLKYAPVTSCTSRLMLCRDPSITYIGLILNSSQPTLAAKVLRGMPVQQLIALSWRNEVTLLQLVTAMWTRYKRQKRVLVQLVRQLEDGESLLQEEAAIEEEEVMEEVTPSLSVLSTDPYQYLPKEKLKVEPKNGSSGESEIDLTLVCRVCLESMNEYRQDLTMLLWWARCRLLSYAQLPGTMQEEVLVETDFFYDIIHCKDIFKEILKEKDCVQRKKMNRVMENYQKARKQGSAGYSDVENTSLALVQAALQAYDDTYASLVGTIADTSFTWRRDKLLRRENGSRQSQANAFWSIIHTTVPHNDRFLRENFTSYESFWQFSLIVDYHITHVVSAVFRTTAGETSSILAQMLHLLKTRPEYYPHTILKVVGVYDLELSTIAFTMGLAPIAIELFYRYAPQMPLPPPKKELLEMSPAVEEEEEIQEEETVQTESEPHIVEGVTFIENEEEEAAIAEEISEASSDDDSFSLVLSPKSDEELRDEVRESSEVSTLTLEAYDTLVTVLLLFQTAIERGETSVNPLTFLLAPEGSPDKPDVITLLHAFMLQTRYPYLAAISTMGLAACAHHNISDMVPAYVERGIIESVFRILARPLSTRLYRELAEKEKAGLENDYTTLTEREAFYNSVLVKLMIPTLIQALTVHHMTHRAFRLHNRTCLSSIASAMRAVPDCFVLQKANEEYASRWFCHYVPPFGRDVNEIKQSPLEAFRHPQFAAAMERREKNTLVLSSKIRKLLTEEIRPLLVSSFRELQHIFTGFNEMAADVFSIHLARFSAGLRIKNDYDQWSDSSANTLLTRNEEDDAPDTTMTEGAAGSALQRTTIDTIAATYTMFNFFMFLEVPDGGRVQLGRGPEWEGVCTSLSEFVLEIVNLCPVASNGRDGSFDCSFLEIDSRVTLGLDGRRMEPNPIPDVYFPAVCALLHSGSLALFIQQSRRLCPSPLRSSYLLDGLSGFVVNIIQNLDPTTRALTEDQAAVLLPILEMLERLCRPNRIHKSILPSKSLYTLSGVFVQLFIMARYQEKNGQEAAEEEEEPDRAGRDVSQPGVTVVRTTIRVTETGEVQQTVGVVPRDAEFVRLPRPGGDMEDDVEEVDAMEREENNRSPSIDRSNNQNDENDRQANNADAPGASPDKKKGPEKQKSPFLTRNTDHLSLFFERLTKALWYNGKDRSRRSMVPSNNQMPGGCSVFIGAELLISQCERQMQQIMKKLEAPFEKYFNAPNSDELLSSDEKIEAIRRTILLEHLDIDLLKQISTRMIVVDTSQCLRSRDVKNLDNKMLYIIKRAEFISRLLYYKEDPQTKDKGKTNGNGDGTTENSINNLPGASENEKKKSEMGENEDTNVVSTDEKTEEEYKYRKQRAATALARIFYSMIHSPVEPNQRGMPPSFHSMRVMAPLLCITFNLWDHLEGFPRSRTMYMSAIQQITRRRGALLQISAPRRNVPAVERNNPRDLFPFLAVAQPHNRMMRHRFEEERDPERNMGARFDILPFFGDDVDLATEFTNNNDSSSPSTPPPEAPPVAPPAENVDENTKTLRDLFNVTANKYQSDKFDQLSDSYLDWIIQFSCNQYVNLESFSPEVQAGERRNCTAILHAVVKGEREDDRDSDPLSASGAAALTKMFSLVLKDTVVHYPLLDHLSVILSQKSQSMLLNVLANTPLPMAVVEKVLEAMEQVQSAAGEEDKKTKKKVRAMRATLYNFLLCFTAVSGHFGNVKQTTESTAEGHNQCKYFMEGYCRDGHQCPGVHVVAEHDLLEGMSGLFSKPADFKMRVTSVVKKLNDLLEVLRSLGYETKDGEDTVEDNNLDSNDDEKVGTTGEDAKEKESKKGPLPTLDPIRLVQSTISPSFTLLPPEPLQRVLEAIMADLLNTEEGSLIKEDASPTEGGPTERIAAAFPKSNCINWSWRKEDTQVLVLGRSLRELTTRLLHHLLSIHAYARLMQQEGDTERASRWGTLKNTIEQCFLSHSASEKHSATPLHVCCYILDTTVVSSIRWCVASILQMMLSDSYKEDQAMYARMTDMLHYFTYKQPCAARLKEEDYHLLRSENLMSSSASPVFQLKKKKSSLKERASSATSEVDLHRYVVPLSRFLSFMKGAIEENPFSFFYVLFSSCKVKWFKEAPEEEEEEKEEKKEKKEGARKKPRSLKKENNTEYLGVWVGATPPAARQGGSSIFGSRHADPSTTHARGKKGGSAPPKRNSKQESLEFVVACVLTALEAKQLDTKSAVHVLDSLFLRTSPCHTLFTPGWTLKPPVEFRDALRLEVPHSPTSPSLETGSGSRRGDGGKAASCIPTSPALMLALYFADDSFDFPDFFSNLGNCYPHRFFKSLLVSLREAIKVIRKEKKLGALEHKVLEEERDEPAPSAVKTSVEQREKKIEMLEKFVATVLRVIRKTIILAQSDARSQKLSYFLFKDGALSDFLALADLDVCRTDRDAITLTYLIRHTVAASQLEHLNEPTSLILTDHPVSAGAAGGAAGENTQEGSGPLHTPSERQRQDTESDMDDRFNHINHEERAEDRVLTPLNPPPIDINLEEAVPGEVIEAGNFILQFVESDATSEAASGQNQWEEPYGEEEEEEEEDDEAVQEEEGEEGEEGEEESMEEEEEEDSASEEEYDNGSEDGEYDIPMVARGGFYSVYGNDDEMDAFRSFNHPHVMGGRGMRGLFNPQRLVRVQRKQVEVVGLRLYQLLAFIAGRPDRTNTLFTETPLRVLTATAAEEPFSSPLHRTDGSPTGARDRGRPSAGSQERTPQDQIAARSDSGSRRGMRPHIPQEESSDSSSSIEDDVEEMVESSVESEVDSDGNSVAVDDDEPAPQQGEEAEVAPPTAPNAEPEEPVDYSDNELAINRILALFNMADTLTNRNGNAAQADATDNTAAAAAPAEAVPEVVVNPPPEDDQPWLGLVEPTFIESIPQDIRESILFEHMPQLRGEVEYTFLNRQTRVYHSFLSLLPEPVQLNVLDIEGRFAAVHDAPAAEGDGATALYELLLSVESEPEIRQDILRECDITLLANYPELRRESERLRRERLPEAPRLMNMREYPMDVVVRDPFADATRLESIRRIFSRDLSDAHSNNRSSSRIKAVETKPPTCDSEYHVLAPRVVRLSVAEMKMCIRLLKLHTPMKKDSNTDLRTQITALLRTLCGTQRQTVEVLTALLEVGREGLDEQGSPAALTGRSSMFTNVLVLFSELCKVTSIVPIALMLLPDGCLNKETMKDVNAPLDSTEKEYVAHHPLKMLLDYVSVNISASSVTRNLFVTILSNLIQIRDSLVKEDTPKEGGDSLFNRMPESDENIRHPRHEHRLQWTDVSQLASYSEGFICNICGTNPHNRLCFHCGICNFDLCASCGRERLTVEEMTTRLRRCMYYTVNMDGFMQRVVELLESKSSAHYNGTLIRLVKPMLYESAKRDKEYDGPRSAVSVVEEALQRAAGVLTPAIRETRKVFRQAVEDVVRQHLTEAGSPTNAEARQDSFASTVTIPEDIQFDSSEGLQFLEILNMAELEEGQIFSLIAPYVEAQRPEPREISIMWRATQMLIQDTTALLQHLTSPGTLPLPESVVSLFTSYCVYHVHSMKRDRSSASASAFSNRQFVSPGETERFLSEETRDPSPLSTQARKEISENDEGGHRAARGGHNRPNIFDFMLPWQGATFLQDAFRGRGMDDDESENNTPVTTLATNPAAERRPLSRTVRRFLEANRVTLDCILRWNPTLIKTTLSFLQTEPGLIDFSLRIKEFRRRLARNREDSLDITINRQRCLQESFTKMKGKKSYRGSLRVRFEGEEGADAGGLSREWFQLLAKDIVNESYALFIHSSEASTFQPNPLSDVNAEHLEYFEFVGIILGMTIVHNVAIDLHFTRSVYRHMVGLQPIFLDLESVDPELYNNLQWMLKHDVTDIELYFAVNYERFGEVMEEELMPGGKDVLVTESNKLQYIRLLCEFHMTKRISPQLLHLLKGFYTVIPFEEIQNFSAQELELVICGVPDINTDDLRANTLYEGYSASSPQVRWFWEVVQTMTAEDKANLLQFATGASKVPHGGFANLVGTGDLPQKFTISRWMESPELLPLAHTCFNKIDLPEYPSLEVLREKLMLAITFGSMGFTMV